MSDTDEKDCPARTLYDGGEVTCDRDAGHAGVHLGKSFAKDSGRELHQWTDAQSIGDDGGPVDQLPVWYAVLPIGKQVRVAPMGDDFRVVEGELFGVVLDDHEQPAAVVVREQLAADTFTRHLYPWHIIGGLSWAEDQ